MSGHSKWKNIMHKKEKTDAARAKVFTKIGKEIAMAVKEGGADPVANTKLRDLITKAKSLNVPNDNIKRIIDKASDDNSAAYEMVTYEGYGPGGVAVIVETATDNRNRTAPEVRHALSKFGGNMGTTGCVSFMFSEKGVIVVDNEDGDVDEDVLMDDALEAGAGDILTEEGAFEVYTEPSEFAAVCEALSAKGYKFLSADLEKVPASYVELSEEQAVQMQKMLDMLEENDDVQNVFHNWDE
ncbi:MAG: YebC/PmpR family DNA-binding transcriptional regulator [Clostridia bacterium]|nr:YebC/PmpR family DNA-binding transcriptional regulator [Clostridia bacterium]MBQ5792253.1 YebC/PmpR family DNA-binding transcriptional regulator [Clostridia bacterium]